MVPPNLQQIDLASLRARLALTDAKTKPEIVLSLRDFFIGLNIPKGPVEKLVLFSLGKL